MADASSSSSSLQQPLRTAHRSRPTRCYVRVLPTSVASHGQSNTRTQHQLARDDGYEEEEPSALYADNKEERQLTIPSYVAADGRHRHATSARWDGVFGAGANEDDGHVYEVIGAPLVRTAQKGESACLFAYGQTGTGKTHNIWNVLLPRAANALLDGGAPAIEVACVQLYNDRIDDLLTAYPSAGGGTPLQSIPDHGEPTPTVSSPLARWSSLQQKTRAASAPTDFGSVVLAARAAAAASGALPPPSHHGRNVDGRAGGRGSGELGRR